MMGTSAVLLIAIGFVAGVLSGAFGIGGGVVIVPALIYLAVYAASRNGHQSRGVAPTDRIRCHGM